MDNYNEFISKIFTAFELNGMKDLIGQTSAERLNCLYLNLVETNNRTNLTAITDEDGVILKHFLDSATICKYIPLNTSVIDVGCGAGFPSLPVAILRSDLTVTSLDSTGKKIDFVKRYTQTASLDNLKAVCARAEDYVSENRECFDVCTSRAVARLNVLIELSLPFVKVGGLFLAMKSNKGEEEYIESRKGIEKLGAKLIEIEKSALSFADEEITREIYVFKKIHPTPNEFPRKYSQILKRPL